MADLLPLAPAHVTLILSDGERVQVSRAVLRPSALVQESDVEVQVELDSRTFAKVLEYLEHHAQPNFPEPELERPLKDADPKVWCKDYPWDAAFAAFDPGDHEDFKRLIFAAKALQIESLIDLTAAMLASKLLNKTPNEVRAAFGFKKPTRAEEEEDRKNKTWVLDLVSRVATEAAAAEAAAAAAAAEAEA